jgi:hypothetical protein
MASSLNGQIGDHVDLDDAAARETGDPDGCARRQAITGVGPIAGETGKADCPPQYTCQVQAGRGAGSAESTAWRDPCGHDAGDRLAGSKGLHCLAQIRTFAISQREEFSLCTSKFECDLSRRRIAQPKLLEARRVLRLRIGGEEFYEARSCACAWYHTA